MVMSKVFPETHSYNSKLLDVEFDPRKVVHICVYIYIYKKNYIYGNCMINTYYYIQKYAMIVFLAVYNTIV